MFFRLFLCRESSQSGVVHERIDANPPGVSRGVLSPPSSCCPFQGFPIVSRNFENLITVKAMSPGKPTFLLAPLPLTPLPQTSQPRALFLSPTDHGEAGEAIKVSGCLEKNGGKSPTYLNGKAAGIPVDLATQNRQARSEAEKLTPQVSGSYCYNCVELCSLCLVFSPHVFFIHSRRFLFSLVNLV